MKKIICIMGKSATGKSTIINYITKRNSDFFSVKSYSNRPIRENDPNDINTHIFVDKKFKKKNVLSIYEDKTNNYENWITDDCFHEEKINLFAIDSISFIDFYTKYNKRYEIIGVYLYLDEKEREQRFKKRSSLPFSSEEHLSHKHLDDNKTPYIMINITNKDISACVESFDQISFVHFRK